MDFLAALAAQEHPQTVAMILSHLESNVAAHILARLPETMRVEVIARVATMDRVPPDVLKEVERVVEAKIRSAGTDRLSNSGGAETAAGILDLSGCSVEQQVLEALGSRDPALAEEIRSRRFGFDDLALLGPEERRAVLKHVERRDVLLALRAAGERVREAVLESYGEAERSRLQRDRGEGGRDGGRVRLNEVEAAQRRIANVMRQLADTGASSAARTLIRSRSAPSGRPARSRAGWPPGSLPPRRPAPAG